jgi:hypothetical protein
MDLFLPIGIIAAIFLVERIAPHQTSNHWLCRLRGWARETGIAECPSAFSIALQKFLISSP